MFPLFSTVEWGTVVGSNTWGIHGEWCVMMALTANLILRYGRCIFTHLLFHINRNSFISFTGGTLMKNSIFILTEQRQSNIEEYTSTIIQQAITAWLTKELRK